MSQQMQNVFATAKAAQAEVNVLLTVIYGAPRIYKAYAYQIGNAPIRQFPNQHEDCPPSELAIAAKTTDYTLYEGPWRRFGTYQHGWKFGPITATMPERIMPVDQVEDEALSRRMERMFAMRNNTDRVVNRKEGNHPNAIYVGRPTHFGNPFTHLMNVKGAIRVDTRDDAVELQRQWLAGEIEIPDLNQQRIKAIGEILTLRNRQIECWCSPEACHGTTLALWADSRPPIRVLVTPTPGIAAKLTTILASKPGEEIEILPIMTSGTKEQAIETTAWAAHKGAFQTPMWLPNGNPTMCIKWTVDTLAAYATHVIADDSELGNALSSMAYHTGKPYRNY